MASDPLAYKRDAKLQARLNAEVQALLKRPDNAACADCGATRTVRFCSVTLGVFLCNRCYGLHRNVGAHVTRTKCVGLDLWHPDEVRQLREVGNARARAVYEASVPPGVARPTEASSDRDADRWIRDKYERRRYYAAAAPPPAPPPAPTPAPSAQAALQPPPASLGEPVGQSPPAVADLLGDAFAPPPSAAAAATAGFAADFAADADFEAAFAAAPAPPPAALFAAAPALASSGGAAARSPKDDILALFDQPLEGPARAPSGMGMGMGSMGAHGAGGMMQPAMGCAAPPGWAVGVACGMPTPAMPPGTAAGVSAPGYQQQMRDVHGRSTQFGCTGLVAGLTPPGPAPWAELQPQPFQPGGPMR